MTRRARFNQFLRDQLPEWYYNVQGKILSTAKDYRSKVDLKQSLSTQSLTLIQPQEPDFYIKTTSQGSNQPRVKFEFDGHQYDPPITDPAWRDQVAGDVSGSLPSVDDIDEGEALLFTISLGEEFDGLCYTIVAAIFTLDDKLLLRI